MTPAQKQLVKSSFAKVMPIADAAAKIFYDRLFEQHPEVKPLFHGDMKVQGRKLMDMLLVCVSKLDTLEDFIPNVEKLGGRHGRYAVKDEHYPWVKEALVYTLDRGLGADFTGEVREAWGDLYDLLSEAMRRGMREAVA